MPACYGKYFYQAKNELKSDNLQIKTNCKSLDILDIQSSITWLNSTFCLFTWLTWSNTSAGKTREDYQQPTFGVNRLRLGGFCGRDSCQASLSAECMRLVCSFSLSLRLNCRPQVSHINSRWDVWRNMWSFSLSGREKTWKWGKSI